MPPRFRSYRLRVYYRTVFTTHGPRLHDQPKMVEGSICNPLPSEGATTAGQIIAIDRRRGDGEPIKNLKLKWDGSPCERAGPLRPIRLGYSGAPNAPASTMQIYLRISATMRCICIILDRSEFRHQQRLCCYFLKFRLKPEPCRRDGQADAATFDLF